MPSPIAAAASIRAAAPSMVPTSARTAEAFAPLTFSRATAASAAASSDPYPSTIGRPDRASRSAIARPIPFVPPVTIVVIFPSSHLLRRRGRSLPRRRQAAKARRDPALDVIDELVDHRH